MRISPDCMLACWLATDLSMTQQRQYERLHRSAKNMDSLFVDLLNLLAPYFFSTTLHATFESGISRESGLMDLGFGICGAEDTGAGGEGCRSSHYIPTLYLVFCFEQIASEPKS